MFDELEIDVPRPVPAASFAAAAVATPPSASLDPCIVACLLDQIDYGLVVLDAELAPRHANRTALDLMSTDHPLRLDAGRLEARAARDATRLRAALQGGARGLRSLLLLGAGEQRSCVAVIPLRARDGLNDVLLVLGRRSLCEDLTIQEYARSCGLTLAESRVLHLLHQGVPPREIAHRQGVEMSTIRTQIGSIRTKTGQPTVSAVLRDIGTLPPLMSVLRLSSGRPRLH